MDACVRCGASVEPGQEYCLACGARLATPRRRPFHWGWPVGAAALIAALGAAVAVAAGGNDGSATTIVALSPHRSHLAGRPAVKSRAPAEARVRSWPRRNGYTVVLAVVPTSAGVKAARARALAAIRAGLGDVGVLESSRYASLHPGYRVVFSGVYRTLEEALRALPKAAHHTRSAYAQQITR